MTPFTLPFEQRVALYPEILKWSPASGHPGGWRVTRETPQGMEELNGKTGNRILFRSLESANRRAKKLNSK
jgi:hypothetical protein